ncbi:ATP-binding domain-containing protein [Stenotrophomonas acidaminiphila]|uniref:ATP-binding domain-containing protein n=1 Tax=Stenotrophomonas acidaminiphila TaxID=128780 RepID=UPI0028AB78A2|nr:ATP-binding domain-containing protein [Stenotrophomonas acidaminiphila]
MSGTWWKEPSELIQEQIDILDIDPEVSVLIKGPPGSGKTNLLLLRANYLFLADIPDLSISVFGSVLRDFIKTGAGIYKFPPEKVVTHARLFSECIEQSGGALDVSGLGFKEAREVRRVALAGLIQSGKVGQHLQAIFLDEAQDYLPEEIEIAASLAPVLVAACDSRQKIFDGKDCIDVLEKKVEVCKELKYHFRNGRSICRAADEIMKDQSGYSPMTGGSQYNEEEYPSDVTINNGLGIEAQAAAIAERVSKQLDAYPGDKIGIIVPKVSDLDELFGILLGTSISSSLTRCGSSDFQPSRSVWLSTMAGAKGLEFRAVHMAGLDCMSKMGPNQRRLAFTSITRAKTVLSLYYEKNIPGYLERVVRLFMPQKNAVTKNMIFGMD